MAIAIIPPWLEKLTSMDVSLSDIVAWWGAVAGTVALGWNILRDARSKRRVKLEAIYEVDGTRPFLPPVFAVQVTNVGSRPILVQGIAIQRKKGSGPSHHFFPCRNPIMLARGKFFVQVIDRTGWLPMGAARMYPWDSNGHSITWLATRQDR